MKRRIEIFTADCLKCKEALEIIRQEACDECEIIERHCSNKRGSHTANDHLIDPVPTITADGKIELCG